MALAAHAATFEEVQREIAAQEKEVADRAQQYGSLSQKTLVAVVDLGSLYKAQGRYGEAEASYRRAFDILGKMASPNQETYAIALNNLGLMYLDLGRYADAEPLLERNLSVMEKLFGRDSPKMIAAVVNLAVLYADLGRYAEAEPLYREGLALREKSSGIDHPEVASMLGNMNVFYRRVGKYREAEAAAQRGLLILERAAGDHELERARLLSNLGVLYIDLGRAAEAEPLIKRVIAIRESSLGPQHPSVGIALNNLATVLAKQGRTREAVGLQLRSLEIDVKTFGLRHPRVETSLSNLGGLYVVLGDIDEAERVYRRALSISEALHGPHHRRVGERLNELASVYQRLGRNAEAGEAIRRSISIFEKTLGPEHPELADALTAQAAIEGKNNKGVEAEIVLKRALLIYETAYGPAHPRSIETLGKLAAVSQDHNNYEDALNYSRRAYALLSGRFSRVADLRDSQLAEQKANRNFFASHVSLLGRRTVLANLSESFEAAQWAHASGVADTVVQMANRFAGKDGRMASAIRGRQDTAQQLARLDKSLIEALGQPAAQRDAGKISRLRATGDSLEKSLQEQSRAISTDFPAYENLVSALPVPLSQTQQMLRSGEALVLYLVDNSGVFAWVVRRNGAEFKRLGLTSRELSQRVAALRGQLDPIRNRDRRPFDIAGAAELYQKIFAPLESALAGVDQIIVVPDGALQSLPLGVLVAQQGLGTPRQAAVSKDRVGAVSGNREWLADRYAMSVIPTVSALRALRGIARNTSADLPFIGFGDPLLDGPKAPGATNGVAVVPPPGGGNVADVEMLRQATPLPDTAEELTTMADTLGAEPKSIFLRQAAAESVVKSLDLTRYRIVAFSTHGVMAGQVPGVPEAGLILTPPPAGTPLDDGYLSAGEIAQLKLNADWVILSACNTAASDGAPDAEGLSGLAKAFFFSGARSLLVSHWPVSSKAATQLTTQLLKFYREETRMSKAEALRRSMHALRKDPRYAHPTYWAPFVVVGEG